MGSRCVSRYMVGDQTTRGQFCQAEELGCSPRFVFYKDDTGIEMVAEAEGWDRRIGSKRY